MSPECRLSFYITLEPFYAGQVCKIQLSILDLLSMAIFMGIIDPFSWFSSGNLHAFVMQLSQGSARPRHPMFELKARARCSAHAGGGPAGHRAFGFLTRPFGAECGAPSCVWFLGADLAWLNGGNPYFGTCPEWELTWAGFPGGFAVSTCQRGPTILRNGCVLVEAGYTYPDLLELVFFLDTRKGCVSFEFPETRSQIVRYFVRVPMYSHADPSHSLFVPQSQNMGWVMFIPPCVPDKWKQ